MDLHRVVCRGIDGKEGIDGIDGVVTGASRCTGQARLELDIPRINKMHYINTFMCLSLLLHM